MPYYIHIDDPQFYEPPFPGQRRLGPYPTKAEAFEQAVEDCAGGHGTPLGVFEEKHSEKLRDDTQTETKPAYTSEEIKAEADKRVEVRVQERIRRRQEDLDALKTVLPSSIEAGEVM